MRNAFGKRIPANPEILSDQEVAGHISTTLEELLQTLGHPAPAAATRHILQLAKSQARKSFERTAHEYLRTSGVIPKLQQELRCRAAQEHAQIKGYVQGPLVLDYGCGDGEVGRLLAEEGNQVMLADVYRHPHIDAITRGGNPRFTLIPHTGSTPLDSQYDTTLLLTVLHHCKDPQATLKEAVQCTREAGKVIVIESVYGVNDGPLARLSREQQWNSAFFFDRFYNNVITDPALGVHTPGNYLTPGGWSRVFRDHGLAEKDRISIGIDLAIVPEYHVLYVLEKQYKCL